MYQHTGHGQVFSFLEYLCIRVLSQEHFVLLYPSCCLLLKGDITRMEEQLHHLVRNFGSSFYMKHHIIQSVIDQMKQLSVISEAQWKKLRSMNYGNHEAVMACFASFQVNDSLTEFQSHLFQLVKTSPLGPPSFSLRDSSFRAPTPDQFMSTIDILSVRLIRSVEKGHLQNNEALQLLYACVLCPLFITLLLQIQEPTSALVKPLIQNVPVMFDMSLRELMFIPNPYPDTLISQLLQLLRRSFRLTTLEHSVLLTLCKQKSLSLYYCYVRYVHSSSQTVFLSLSSICCKDVDDSEETGEKVSEGRPALPCAQHESVLQSLVTQGALSDQEAGVIADEYLREQNSIVKQAFCVHEKHQDIKEFSVVLKRFASIYSSLL